MVGAGLLVLAAGCATPTSPELDRARASYDAAVRGGLDPASSVDLYEAKKQLDAASRALEKGRDLDEVAHFAYLAETRVEIAKLGADTSAARARAQALTEERSQILIEARSQEALSASERAAAAERAAREARTQAMVAEQERQAAAARAAEAEERAREMERKLSDFETRQTERGLVLTLGGVLFAFDSADLKPEASERIVRLAGFLIGAPDRSALIEGYTDDLGDDAYNLTLSRRRAETVRQALIDQGVSPARLVADGYGEAYPVAPNDSDANRQRNRRVEIVILDPGEAPETARRAMR
jgi:outer membrane protein OmpA-like peptidoglycan-associated protein